MSLIISLLFTTISAQACPLVHGIYTCTTENEVDQIQFVQTVEDGITVYEIIDKKEDAPFEMKFITDGVERTQQEPIVDEDTGREFGTMTVKTKASCSDLKTVNFLLDMKMHVMGTTMGSTYTGLIKSEGIESFTIDSVEVLEEADGSKTVKESHSVCTKN